MTPKLPKDFLWTDKKSIPEFFELDPLNGDFYEVLSELPANDFVDKISYLDVFNEVYYQATRLIFERPLQNGLRGYVADIKADMGWNYCVQLVMSMLYHLLLLYDLDDRQTVLVHVEPIRMSFYSCPYWKPFKHCFERLKKEGKRLKYSFEPCPLPAEDIYWRYGSWDKLTMNYDMDAITKLLGLWKDNRDSAIIAGRISDSMAANLRSLDMIAKRNQLEAYIKAFVKQRKKKSEVAKKSLRMTTVPDETYEDLKRENIKLQDVNKQLLSRISELESDNVLLKQQKSDNTKTDGDHRTFTLPEIRKYCVNCVGWDDAKSIVAMLNKLLRGVCTNEDSELVDSIEIEFKNRKSGDAVSGNKTSVGDYSSMVNFVLPPNVDYDKVFAAIPDDIKDIWRKQLTQKDNG